MELIGQQSYCYPEKAFLDQDYSMITMPGTYRRVTTFQCACKKAW